MRTVVFSICTLSSRDDGDIDWSRTSTSALAYVLADLSSLSAVYSRVAMVTAFRFGLKKNELTYKQHIL